MLWGSAEVERRLLDPPTPAEGVSLRAVGAVLVVGGYACFEEGAAFFSLTLELFVFVLGEEVLH